jgi:hypothetical protein
MAEPVGHRELGGLGPPAPGAHSERRKDENGFLHVAVSHISKETVNPYRGREIPGWSALGLDPDRIYQGYRSGAALKAGAETFNGLPLLMDHHPDSAENPQKEYRVGSLGTDAAFNSPYLDNSLILTDARAIELVESGLTRELSASYRYEPDFTPGEFQGQPYDFVMTNIRGNHVALVEEGRAGRDVLVADSAEPEGWITVNGARVPLDENGEPAGAVGEAIKSETGTSWEPSQAFSQDLEEHNGDHVKAARAFYKRELQGKSFEGDMGESKPRKVQVIGGTWDEIKSHMRENPVKAELVPHIPEIIESGEYVGRRETPDHDKYQAFRTKFKEVETNGKRVKAMLDVGELNNGLFAYSLNHEGSPTWEDKKRYLREMEAQGEMRGGKGTKMPGFDASFEEGAYTPWTRISPGISEDSIAEGGGNVNLFILEVTDIKTGKRLPEYEDELTDADQRHNDTNEKKGLIMNLLEKLKEFFAGLIKEGAKAEEIKEALSQALPAAGAEGPRPPDGDQSSGSATEANADESPADMGPGVTPGAEDDEDGCEQFVARLAAVLKDIEPDALYTFQRGLDNLADKQKFKEIAGRIHAAMTGAAPAATPSPQGPVAPGPQNGDQSSGSATDPAASDSSAGLGAGLSPAAALIRRQARAEAVAEVTALMRAKSQAADLVRPLVGSLDIMAFDSAADIHRHALKSRGLSVSTRDLAALKDMVAMELRHLQAEASPATGIAFDAAPVKYEGPFAHLGNIRVAH